MSHSLVLKDIFFFRIYEIRENIEFQGFWEGDFGTVFKNPEKRYCIGYARTFQLLTVLRLNLKFRSLGTVQNGMTTV